MLHAFNVKNVRRVLTSTRNEHTISKNEDGVTSMVFTPLAFMSPQATAAVLGELVGPSLVAAFNGRSPLGHEVSLWPAGLRDTAVAEGPRGGCEPDLIVTFEFAFGPPLVVIGEMKWDWNVTAEHLQGQTDGQARAVSARHPTADQVRFAVTKRRFRVPLVGVVVKTWIEVQGDALRLARRSTATPQGRWGLLVAEFLTKAEQMDFQGFTALLPLTPPLVAPVFWSDSDD